MLDRRSHSFCLSSIRKFLTGLKGPDPRRRGVTNKGGFVGMVTQNGNLSHQTLDTLVIQPTLLMENNGLIASVSPCEVISLISFTCDDLEAYCRRKLGEVSPSCQTGRDQVGEGNQQRISLIWAFVTESRWTRHGSTTLGSRGKGPVAVIGLLRLKRGEASPASDDEHARTTKKQSLKRAKAAAAPRKQPGAEVKRVWEIGK